MIFKSRVVNLDPMPWRKGDTREQRFASRVQVIEGGCHEWIGPRNDRGYGVFYYAGEKKRAHREAWERVNGATPVGMVLDHVCLNRACVNVDHLRVATVKQNAENFTGAYPSNTSGYRGVSYYRPRGTWYGRVEHFGRVYVTRYCKTPEEANREVIELRKSLHTHNELDRRAA